MPLLLISKLELCDHQYGKGSLILNTTNDLDNDHLNKLHELK